VEWNRSWWSGVHHGGMERVIVEQKPVLELTLVQVIQARPLRCWLCHIVSVIDLTNEDSSSDEEEL